MNERTIKYWQEISEYDIVTAQAMYDTGRYLYVAFMCHQSIEKILKAYYVKTLGETPPYIHGLMILADKSGIIKDLSDGQLEFIRQLDPMNIEARYPRYKDQIFNKLTKEICLNYINKTKELWEWINRKL